jgi:hypothetical protein
MRVQNGMRLGAPKILSRVSWLISGVQMFMSRMA